MMLSVNYEAVIPFMLDVLKEHLCNFDNITIYNTNETGKDRFLIFESNDFFVYEKITNTRKKLTMEILLDDLNLLKDLDFLIDNFLEDLAEIKKREENSDKILQIDEVLARNLKKISENEAYNYFIEVSEDCSYAQKTS